jgi:hypothetical protein
MGAGKIQFERINAHVLAALHDLGPGVLVIFLHDRGDKDAVGELIFALLEFIEPDVERPVADELNIFPADDVFAIVAHQLRVTRRDVDHLRRIETDRLRNDRAPAFAESARDDVQIRPRRPRADHEWIR